MTRRLLDDLVRFSPPSTRSIPSGGLRQRVQLAPVTNQSRDYQGKRDRAGRSFEQLESTGEFCILAAASTSDMDHEFSFDEHIELTVVSIHRNLFSSVLFGIATFLLQGFVFVLFAFLFDRLLVRVLLICLGSLIIAIGLFSLVRNLEQALLVRERMEAMKAELSEQPGMNEDHDRE